MIKNGYTYSARLVRSISSRLSRLFRSRFFSTKHITHSYKEGEPSLIPGIIDFESATPLCHLMKKWGSDKALFSGRGMHNYTTVYYQLFKSRMSEPVNLFELGIGSINSRFGANMGLNGKPGASLRAWSEFFEKGMIYGADIDRDILFETDRIHTFYCDQFDPAVIIDMWNSHFSQTEFDFIIDDGMHEFNHNICFFENSWFKLKKGGIYIVEDVPGNELHLWEARIETFVVKYPDLRFSILPLPNRFNKTDNNLVVIQRAGN